ncbi:hypothetical protein HI802_02970 [Ralstonia solanacearum]|nr:hypothetical protein HI802_02970 [Ralstonia solanacearum]QKL96220.1 hypothetical protein HI801_02970 [Ralstonia solanacearum]QLR09334.1 hypothetical protein H1A20_02945 [Ralstonia solanacearum]
MDEKTVGSWLIHHTQRLQRVESQRGYERIYKAGKAGILLSAISADKQSVLPITRVEALASAANINTVFELPELLKTLRDRDVIDQSQNGVSVLGVTTQSTLLHTAKIFEAIQPTDAERASLAIAESASEAPLSINEAMEVGDRFRLPSALAKRTIDESCDIGFVDVESLPGGEQLLFNGNLFRRDDPVKIKRVLDSLSHGDRQLLSETTAHLQQRGCVEVTEVQRILGAKLFEKVMTVGFFDLNVVSNSKEETGFVTLPSAFRKYSTSMVEDAFDLAKAFVSSITYGMTKSSSARGRIDMVAALLRTLIRGEPIGPVPAIAEDYKILELKGVVRVASGAKKGRQGPMMWLLKKEVGELALQVILQGDASEHSLDALPSAAVSRYRGPEENQQRIRKKQLQQSPSATNDILRVLRTTGAK